jgi:hypothetical protein
LVDQVQQLVFIGELHSTESNIFMLMHACVTVSARDDDMLLD